MDITLPLGLNALQTIVTAFGWVFGPSLLMIVGIYVFKRRPPGRGR